MFVDGTGRKEPALHGTDRAFRAFGACISKAAAIVLRPQVRLLCKPSERLENPLQYYLLLGFFGLVEITF